MSSFYSNNRRRFNRLSRNNRWFLLRIIVGTAITVGYVAWNPFHAKAWVDIATGAILLIIIVMNARVF